MKNLIVLAVAIFAFTQIGMAQSAMKIGKIGFSLSPMGESYGVSSFDEILDLAKNKNEVIRDLSEFEGDLVACVSGGYAGLQFMLTPKKANRALLLNASLALGKEMFISSNEFDPFAGNQFGIDGGPDQIASPFSDDFQAEEVSTAAYCVVENEFRLDATWVHLKTIGKRFTLYGGFGGAVGATYNNDFIVMGNERIENAAEDEAQFREINETYESKNSVLGRAHAYGGVGYRFAKHYEVAIEGKHGIGVQKALGGPSHFIRGSGVYGLTIRYVL